MAIVNLACCFLHRRDFMLETLCALFKALLKQDTNAAFKVLSVNEKENPYLVSLRQQIFNLNLMPFSLNNNLIIGLEDCTL